MHITQHAITDAEDNTRLDRILKRLGLTQGMARLVRTGQVRVNGKRADMADRVHTGDVVRVPMHDAPLPVRENKNADIAKQQLNAMMLYQDADLMILNKPSGMATQGGSGVLHHIDGLLMAVGTGQRRPVLVHRLDKDTSGCLLIAKKPSIAAALGKIFYARKVHKSYRALVRGAPSATEGSIEVPLQKRMTAQGERMVACPNNPLAQKAYTQVQVLETVGNAVAWVAMSPLTGRNHQLRVHAAYWQHPIVGDAKYGALPFGTEDLLGDAVRDVQTLHLHAHRLVFVHPATQKSIDVVAPLPPHMHRSCKALGIDYKAEDTLLEQSSSYKN